MTIALIGFSHHRTPTYLRNQIAFPEAQHDHLLQDLKRHGFDEAIILSTCNRTEIYIRHQHCERLIHWWQNHCQLKAEIFAEHAYIRKNEEAVEHAIRVTCGLDSLVLGEPQILGQFKQALRRSHAHGMVGSKLNFAVKRILAAAKQVRHETAIGHCPVSVALSSLRLAEKHTTLTDASLLLIGAGDTTQLMLKHLAQTGVRKLHIANRTVENARMIGTPFLAEAHALTEVPNLLPTVDIVISATAAKQPIITSPDLIELDAQRTKPLLMIDLAMPQDIEPCTQALKNIQQFNVDDIGAVIRDNTLALSQAAIHAYEVIQKHMADYRRQKQALDANHVICAMREKAETIKTQELAKAFKSLQAGADAEQTLQRLAQSLTQKWLHTPSTSLSEAGANGEKALLELAHDLFDL